MTTTKPPRPSVKLVAGHATTTSLKVAEYFGKEHYRVIRAIENLECSPAFRAANFGASSYINAQNKTMPMRTMTKDGFVFLAMGFTGKEAAQWKEKYIEAFNHLEARAACTAAKTIRRKVLAEQAAERRKLLPAPEQSLEAQALARLRAGKFVLYFGEAGFMTLHSVSRRAIVAEPGELAGRIADPKGDIGREYLSGIIQAAAKRLA